MGRPRIAVLRPADIVEGEDRPPLADPDTFQNPGLVGPDLQFLQKPVRDHTFRMKMADAVQIEHQINSRPMIMFWTSRTPS